MIERGGGTGTVTHWSREVESSSRAMKKSASGIHRVFQSSRYTGSFTGFQSRKGSMMLSDSRNMGRSAIQKKAIRVLDEDGNDVTPRPLHQPEPKDPHAKPTRFIFDDVFSKWDASKSSSFSNVPSSGSFMWSSRPPSMSTRPSLTTHSEEGAFKLDNIPLPGCCFFKMSIERYRKYSILLYFFVSLPEAKRQAVTVSQHVPEEIALDEIVNIYLTETDTITLLDLPSTCVSEDADDAQAIKESNILYVELCKNKMGNDKYVARAVQTFVGASKHKKIQSEKVFMQDEGTMATIWEIFDSFQSEAPKMEKAAAAADSTMGVRKGRDARAGESYSSASTIGTASTRSSLFSITQGNALSEELDPQVILQSETFQRNLFVMERCIAANIFQPKLAAYRQLPEIQDPYLVTQHNSEENTKEQEEDEDKEEKEVEEQEEEVIEEEGEEEEEQKGPALEHLWTFCCELTKGRNITSMAWNKQNPDLLAVGYGDFKYWQAGLICCWSIKNLMWPERLYHCHSSVTALDFSTGNPEKLAVGMHDGTVAVFSVRSKDQYTYLASSRDCAKKHVHPVWYITWARQEMRLSEEDTMESMVSVSEDGHIIKWLLCSSGLDGIDMLELRRIQDGFKKTDASKTKKEDILVSTATPGLCVAFQPTDPSIYLAGTSEGVIHKCSVSNHHHYLTLYQKHLCHVNYIEWSPFSPNLFLSCSSDWTIQLWKDGCPTPVKSFSFLQTPVLSVRWSPLWPSVFASINEEQLEIWDLNESLLDPVIVQAAEPGVHITVVLFARWTDCIVVGDTSGQVTFYKINNLSVGPGRKVPNLEDLIHFGDST
ncbi:dynein axonemal intermediate chain 4 [Dunckerocampus dactyliophorus]|uniref:dynein axonemal intermediate chain 4 n=1 Tax=Dunckerocampus dactyliophorus TaxID=161453 RepID=UPI0024075A82|nr:dynein axonemal intermediate chain 4 [Dunckerocampus dactyliophorus]